MGVVNVCKSNNMRKLSCLLIVLLTFISATNGLSKTSFFVIKSDVTEASDVKDSQVLTVEIANTLVDIDPYTKTRRIPLSATYEEGGLRGTQNERKAALHINEDTKNDDILLTSYAKKISNTPVPVDNGNTNKSLQIGYKQYSKDTGKPFDTQMQTDVNDQLSKRFPFCFGCKRERAFVKQLISESKTSHHTSPTNNEEVTEQPNDIVKTNRSTTNNIPRSTFVDLMADGEFAKKNEYQRICRLLQNKKKPENITNSNEGLETLKRKHQAKPRKPVKMFKCQVQKIEINLGRLKDILNHAYNGKSCNLSDIAFFLGKAIGNLLQKPENNIITASYDTDLNAVVHHSQINVAIPLKDSNNNIVLPILYNVGKTRFAELSFRWDKITFAANSTTIPQIRSDEHIFMLVPAIDLIPYTNLYNAEAALLLLDVENDQATTATIIYDQRIIENEDALRFLNELSSVVKEKPLSVLTS